jgi:cation-transporting ATPase E
VGLVAASGLAYVVIFSLPPAREAFLLDPSNIALTTAAVTIGLLGAAAVELSWWVQGRVIGDRRRLWRSPVRTTMAAGNRMDDMPAG